MPSVIGTSPKRSPGLRSPTTRWIPSTSLHGLDSALEQGEQRPPFALVRGVLAGDEADVGRRARQQLPALGAQGGEVRDVLDLLRCDHGA